MASSSTGWIVQGDRVLPRDSVTFCVLGWSITGQRVPAVTSKPPPNCPGCAILIDVDVDELQHALGGIVLEAAYMERVLRAAFSALVGSKYAAVVDGRLMAAALIEDCERITKYHTSITQSAKQAVQTALRACHQANTERNRVIHDTWATRPGNVIVTLQGSRASHEVTVTVRMLDEVRQLAGQLANAANDLSDAMTAALGPDWALVEDQLRQELGHDINTDLGS